MLKTLIVLFVFLIGCTEPYSSCDNPLLWDDSEISDGSYEVYPGCYVPPSHVSFTEEYECYYNHIYYKTTIHLYDKNNNELTNHTRIIAHYAVKSDTDHRCD